MLCFEWFKRSKGQLGNGLYLKTTFGRLPLRWHFGRGFCLQVLADVIRQIGWWLLVLLPHSFQTRDSDEDTQMKACLINEGSAMPILPIYLIGKTLLSIESGRSWPKIQPFKQKSTFMQKLKAFAVLNNPQWSPDRVLKANKCAHSIGGSTLKHT